MTPQITAVWKQVTPELEAELADFWIENQAIAVREVAVARAKQAVCIARDDDGKIVGVSTAHPRIVPRLRQPLYYYRNFIAAAYRGQQLALPFLQQSKQVLQDFNLALPAPRCIGIIIELENQSLAAHRNEAHWPESGFVFIGYSPKGLHLRVWYFDGVRLLPPAPARARKPALASAS